MVQSQEEEPRYVFRTVKDEHHDLIKDAVKISVERHTRALEAILFWFDFRNQKRERIARVKRFGELLRSSSH